jgi:hypothetical protein
MHANKIAAEEVAAQMIARCRAGFKDPKHWTNWRKKYDAQIAALPAPLRNAVVAAWDNSGPSWMP